MPLFTLRFALRSMAFAWVRMAHWRHSVLVHNAQCTSHAGVIDHSTTCWWYGWDYTLPIYKWNEQMWELDATCAQEASNTWVKILACTSPRTGLAVAIRSGWTQSSVRIAQAHSPTFHTIGPRVTPPSRFAENTPFEHVGISVRQLWRYCSPNGFWHDNEKSVNGYFRANSRLVRLCLMHFLGSGTAEPKLRRTIDRRIAQGALRRAGFLTLQLAWPKMSPGLVINCSSNPSKLTSKSSFKASLLLREATSARGYCLVQKQAFTAQPIGEPSRVVSRNTWRNRPNLTLRLSRYSV